MLSTRQIAAQRSFWAYESIRPNHPERVPAEPLQLAFEQVLALLGPAAPANDAADAAASEDEYGLETPPKTEAQALKRDLLIAAAALPLGVVYLTCAVLFGRFLYNSNKNARLFGTYPVARSSPTRRRPTSTWDRLERSFQHQLAPARGQRLVEHRLQSDLVAAGGAFAVLAIVIVQALAWRQDKTARELGAGGPVASAGTR